LEIDLVDIGFARGMGASPMFSEKNTGEAPVPRMIQKSLLIIQVDWSASNTPSIRVATSVVPGQSSDYYSTGAADAANNR
jgi:hypothetical protein